MEPKKIIQFVSKQMPKLAGVQFKELAKRHCESPIYNPKWEEDKDLMEGCEIMKTFIEQSDLKGVQNLQILSAEGKTPALFFTVDPTTEGETFTILFYGHYDKIPFGNQWTKGDPYNPKSIDSRYYARGAANGAYGLYSLVTSIRAIQAQTDVGKHPKIAVLIESSKESYSIDLNYHLQTIKDIVTPNLIVCIEGEVPDDPTTFWYTTSMKGEISFDLKVNVLTRGVHSGKNGGLAPDSFMIIQSLLKRIETITDGKVSIPLCEIDLSEEEKAIGQGFIDIVGDGFYNNVPYIHGTKLLGDTPVDIYLNSTFKPSLNIIGYEGIPTIENCSATIRPYTTVRVKLSLPPRKDVNEAKEAIEKALLADPPFKASVKIENYKIIQGGQLPMPDNVKAALNIVSQALESKDIGLQGARVAYPFALYLNATYPDAKMLVTGFGEMNASNIRGINENQQNGYWIKGMASFALFIGAYESYKN